MQALAVAALAVYSQVSAAPVFLADRACRTLLGVSSGAGPLQDPNVILLSSVLGAAQSYVAPGSESTLDTSFGLAVAGASTIFLAVVAGDPNVKGAVKRVRGWLGQAPK